MKHHIIGTVGTIFAALCCLGTPVLLAFLASIGLSFVLHDLILLPLLVVFLGLSLWGLQRSRAVHGHSWPLRLAVLSGGVAFAAVWVSRPLVLLGLLGLVTASVWDIALHQTCPAPAPGPGKVQD